MNILIITGGSKGIGRAIAEKYSNENYRIFSISRSVSKNKSHVQITADLSSYTESVKALQSVLNQINISTLSSITLINNAGNLGEICSLDKLDFEDISKTIQLNTTTPLILSSQFIQHTKKWSCKKQIINISSGAATNPYTGWSVYCSSKSALDMMTKVIAAEQNDIENGVKCIAIYPGVVETNMQVQIRKTSETNFKNVQRFIDLKENNLLYSPQFVADKIFIIDTKNKSQSGDIIDIRTL